MGSTGASRSMATGNTPPVSSERYDIEAKARELGYVDAETWLQEKIIGRIGTFNTLEELENKLIAAGFEVPGIGDDFFTIRDAKDSSRTEFQVFFTRSGIGTYRIYDVMR